MIAEPLTLFVDGYFASPYDACCFIALTEKQLPFATARALLRDGQGVPPGLEALTAVGRVPALRHGDFYLTESLAIVEYLDEVFPANPILPRAPRDRARARQIQAYLRFDLDRLRDERPFWRTLYPAEHAAPLSARAARDARELIAITARWIDGGALAAIGGDAGWSIAHADLALALRRLGDDDAPMPSAVRAFRDVHTARPSVRAYLEHPRPPHAPP